MNIDRRTLLKGLGTAMALPFLDIMAPTTAVAQSIKRPVRMAFMFVPNGISMEGWTPATAGKGFELPEVLASMANLREDMTIFSGLAQMKAFANGDGPGDHARSSATWLTGVQARKTAGTDIEAGISIDQLVAKHLEGKTPFASLELGCERGGMAGNCDSGYSCAYSSSISWRSPSTPVAKEVNPRAVFERLFFNNNSSETAESRAKRQKYELSILDFVKEDADSLRNRLGGRDVQKMDEYFESVREIELRLQSYEKEAKALAANGIKAPTGSPLDRGEHIRLIGDMMVLAFQTDLTRIATFMFANEGSNRAYREINIAEGHHDMSHHGNDPDKLGKKKAIDIYHTEQAAYILNKMKNTPDGDGSLLDNSMVLYGGGIGDGNRHNHDDLPIAVFGKAGGKMPAGQHLVFPSRTPLTNLFLNMADIMGVDVEQLGDSTGKLQGLF